MACLLLYKLVCACLLIMCVKVCTCACVCVGCMYFSVLLSVSMSTPPCAWTWRACLCMDLYFCFSMNVCVFCVSPSSLLSPSYDSLFLLPFLSVLHNSLTSVGLMSWVASSFPVFLYFSIYPRSSSGALTIREDVESQLQYDTQHSVPIPEHGPTSWGRWSGWCRKAGRDKDRTEKFVSGSWGLPVA